MQPPGVASLLFKDEIIPEDVAQEAKGVSVGEDIVPKVASTQGLHLNKLYVRDSKKEVIGLELVHRFDKIVRSKNITFCYPVG